MDPKKCIYKKKLLFKCPQKWYSVKKIWIEYEGLKVEGWPVEKGGEVTKGKKLYWISFLKIPPFLLSPSLLTCI